VVERPAHAVIRCTTRGMLSTEMERFALAHNIALVDALGDTKLTGFYDWEEMRGYSLEARTESTAFLIHRRRRFQSVHVLMQSAIVAMAVNVANLSVGGFIKAGVVRAHFEARYQAALSSPSTGAG
jgi:hypothetical protein